MREIVRDGRDNQRLALHLTVTAESKAAGTPGGFAGPLRPPERDLAPRSMVAALRQKMASSGRPWARNGLQYRFPGFRVCDKHVRMIDEADHGLNREQSAANMQ
jgi:hypothetical protein